MIVGLRHKLYLEWIRKIAFRNGIELEPLLDPLGNATDRLVMHLEHEHGATLNVTIVVPHPPDEWVLR